MSSRVKGQQRGQKDIQQTCKDFLLLILLEVIKNIWESPSLNIYIIFIYLKKKQPKTKTQIFLINLSSTSLSLRFLRVITCICSWHGRRRARGFDYMFLHLDTAATNTRVCPSAAWVKLLTKTLWCEHCHRGLWNCGYCDDFLSSHSPDCHVYHRSGESTVTCAIH